MEFLQKDTKSANVPPSDQALFDLVTVGDIAAAWLLCQTYAEEKASVATLFNHAVTLFHLQEWEKCLAKLDRADRLMNNVASIGLQVRPTVKKALAVMGAHAALLPLHPKSVETCPEYARIRIKWLTALCLKQAGREQEALPIARMLTQQYEINL